MAQQSISIILSYRQGADHVNMNRFFFLLFFESTHIQVSKAVKFNTNTRDARPMYSQPQTYFSAMVCLDYHLRGSGFVSLQSAT